MHIILHFLWEKMVDVPCSSAAVGFTTDEFIKEKALIDGEYTEEQYELTSEGNFSLSKDDENAEMLPWKDCIPML